MILRRKERTAQEYGSSFLLRIVLVVVLVLDKLWYDPRKKATTNGRNETRSSFQFPPRTVLSS
jgi:hypothetical protein